MSARKPVTAAVALALFAGIGGAVTAAARTRSGEVASNPGPSDDRVWWSRDFADPDWVTGRVLLPLSTDAIWTRLEDVEAWTALFSDLRRLQILLREPPHWRVHVESESFFPCGTHDYDIVFRREDRTIDIRIEAPGAESSASLSTREGGERGTLATFRVFVRPTGWMAWFGSKPDLRRRQEDMVIRYLSDLRRIFGTQGSMRPASAFSPAPDRGPQAKGARPEHSGGREP